METRAITVYEFRELSHKAKQRAISDYDSAFGYNNAQDCLESLSAFAERFGSRLTDYSVDWGNSSYSSAKFADVDLEPETLAELVGQLKHDGTCQHTGYCADDDCNEGAVEAWKAGERDVQKLLQAGFRKWLKAAQEDYESQMSDDAFAEHCEANGVMFYADGRVA